MANSTPQDSAIQTTHSVSGIIMMDAAEARQSVNRINNGLSAISDEILNLNEREGWKALGYSSLRECVKAEFNLSQSRGYQLLAFGKVKRNIKSVRDSTNVEKRGSSRGKKGKDSTNVEKNNDSMPNEWQARPLTKVPEDQQGAAWQEAVNAAAPKAPSVAQVAAAAKKYLYRRTDLVKCRGAKWQIAAVLDNGYALKQPDGERFLRQIGLVGYNEIEPFDEMTLFDLAEREKTLDTLINGAVMPTEPSIPVAPPKAAASTETVKRVNLMRREIGGCLDAYKNARLIDEEKALLSSILRLLVEEQVR